MNFIVVTIFPELFDNFLDTSIIKNAIKSEKIEVKVVNLRNYLKNKEKVDSYQLGGGKGMVLRFPPLLRAVKDLKKQGYKIYGMCPQGVTWNQKTAEELAEKKDKIALFCGRYEGFDARIYKYFDSLVSIGDFVLTGGEIPAMVLIESVSRLLDGVIKNESHINDSFNDYLLDNDVYTHPTKFMNKKVPDVLLSGHHKKINDFRIKNKIEKTKHYRPDLYKKYKELKEKKNGEN